MSTRYQIVTKTAVASESKSDAHIYCKLIGADGSVGPKVLDSPRDDFEVHGDAINVFSGGLQGDVNTFTWDDSQVGVEYVGFPIAIELSLEKPGVGAPGDGWKFEWIQVKCYDENGRSTGVAHFNKSGWLDEDPALGKSLLVLWEDEFRKANPVPFDLLVDQRHIVKDNRLGPKDLPAPIIENRTITAQTLQEEFSKSSSETEIKVTVSSEVEGMAKASSEMSQKFGREHGQSTKNSVQFGTEIRVNDQYEIPAHHLGILQVSYTAHGMKLSIPSGGKQIEFHRPRSVSVNTGLVAKFGKNEAIPDPYAKMVTTAGYPLKR